MEARVPNVITPLKGEAVVTRGPSKDAGLPRRGAMPNTPFELMHHPSRWMFDERHGFIPHLGRFFHMTGLDGVDAKGNLSLAEGNLMSRGWSLLKQGDPRLADFKATIHGEPHRGGMYLRRFPVQGGGYHYVTVFLRPHVVGNVTRKWIRDDAAHMAFIRYLMEREVIPPIDEVIRETLIDKRQSAVNRIQQDLYRDPHNKLLESRLRNEARVLAMMRGEDVDIALAGAQAFSDRVKADLTGDEERGRVTARPMPEMAPAPVAEPEPAPVTQKARPKVQPKRGKK